jgi:hypothetical protein
MVFCHQKEMNSSISENGNRGVPPGAGQKKRWLPQRKGAVLADFAWPK